MKNNRILLAVLLLCLSLSLGACSAVPQEAKTDEPVLENQTLSLENPTGTHVFGMYATGYSTINSLLDEAVLIVRGTPVSVTLESPFAICYEIAVEEAVPAAPKTIYLRQLKDSSQLSIGEEAVLVLHSDQPEGYYQIPGGSNGLFRTDPQNGGMRGELLDSLLAQSPSAQSAAALTPAEVFTLLKALY